MDVREWLNKHPRVTYSVAGVCLLAVVGVVAAEMLGNRHEIRTSAPEHYFSVDDGKTYFSTSGSHIAPFDYNGGTAVRAYVFRCGSSDFVGYLERYTPEAQKIELSGKSIPPDVEWYGRELKKPGDSTWISSKDHQSVVKITSVKCPSGGTDAPVRVEPNS